MGRKWVLKREIIYLLLHCQHQNDSCIKLGSDESHFNPPLYVRDKVARQCMSTNHNLFEQKEEPKWNRAEALLLTSLTPYRWAKLAPPNPPHEQRQSPLLDFQGGLNKRRVSLYLQKLL